MNIKFSLIIPALNEEKYLPQLLECLKKQTIKNFEVIVIDAKSSDKTIIRAKKYQSDFPLKIIISSKKNAPYQRNLGAKHAGGEYLIFIDADVVFNHSIFHKITQLIDAQKPAVFYPLLVFPKYKFSYRLLSFYSRIFFRLVYFFKINFANGQFFGIKKQVFNQLGGYNDKLLLSEEHNFLKRLRQHHYQPLYLSHLQIISSPRRLEKDGVWGYLLKGVQIILREKLHGPVYQNQPFNYPMGGDRYV